MEELFKPMDYVNPNDWPISMPPILNEGVGIRRESLMPTPPSFAWPVNVQSSGNVPMLQTIKTYSQVIICDKPCTKLFETPTGQVNQYGFTM